MTKEEYMKDMTEGFTLPEEVELIESIFDTDIEPREKRIAELEESNKEWQRTCEKKSDTNSQLTEQLADKVEKIAELEKENAELKAQLTALSMNKQYYC